MTADPTEPPDEDDPPMADIADWNADTVPQPPTSRHLRPVPTPTHDEPQDRDAEAAVIGALLTKPALLEQAARHLAPDELWNPRHEATWHAIAHLAGQGHPVTTITVANRLKTQGVQGVTTTDLHQLIHNTPPGALVDIGYHARLIHDQARLRAVLATARNLNQLVNEAQPDRVDDTMARALRLVTDTADDVHNGQADNTHAGRLINGADFLRDGADHIDAIWGTGDDVLWARGETLIIAGPQGTGKTTVAQQVALARIGVRGPWLLGYPITPSERVLYLAMDRPQQARRSIRRMVTDDQYDLLAQRLTVWKGPPPARIVDNPRALLELAREVGADTVVIDSVKDMAIGIASDEVGTAINMAMQEMLAADIDVLALHHPRKQAGDRVGKEPESIDDLYGSTFISAGSGSVISLFGQPGDPVVSFKHLKQPSEPVGPYELIHDHLNGITSISHGVDIVGMVRESGVHGITAIICAVSMFPNAMGDPSKSEIEKARRKLDTLVRGGHLVRSGGSKGSGSAARYHLAAYGTSAQEDE